MYPCAIVSLHAFAGGLIYKELMRFRPAHDVAGLLCVLLVTSCAQQAASSSSTAASTSARESATISGVSSQGGGGKCATSQFHIVYIDHQGAAGNGLTRFQLTNTSSTSCTLQGYPGVEITDSSGHRLADAQRSLESYFGNYSAPMPVVIVPNGSSTFDLTYVENDPCTGGVPALHPGAFRVTV